ncbi:hypothetical protein [Amycolatopsis sp. NPDC004079]|uniref:hypothetical protein n=1 Tax=Amycolatopsis sp. NPDC004079 TaxID=3154549 RepID=UPI0033B10BD9
MDDVDLTRRASGLVVVRLRRGAALPGGRLAGESDRTAHLCPVPHCERASDSLTALCGLVILPVRADLLPALTGMPCPACLVRATCGAVG